MRVEAEAFDLIVIVEGIHPLDGVELVETLQCNVSTMTVLALLREGALVPQEGRMFDPPLIPLTSGGRLAGSSVRRTLGRNIREYSKLLTIDNR
ncbi:MAG: hypothetical protein D6675_05380 [Gemmatimonadetes bacterium]|nr:MAG: hypothetical protein D6675_05380 [Gemmatimonadota bacterium]